MALTNFLPAASIEAQPASLHDQLREFNGRLGEMSGALDKIADQLFGPELQGVADAKGEAPQPNSYAATVRYIRNGINACERTISRIQSQL